MALRHEIGVATALAYAPVQVAGCVLGAWLAHLMFSLPKLKRPARGPVAGPERGRRHSEPDALIAWLAA